MSSITIYFICGNTGRVIANSIEYKRDELIKTSKVVKTGAGGIPSKQAFRKEQRSIHPSYIGNIGAHSTGELIISSH